MLCDVDTGCLSPFTFRFPNVQVQEVVFPFKMK